MSPDRKMDETIGHILRFGVGAAALLTLIGLAIYLKQFGAYTPPYRTFHAARMPKGWLEAGVLMLILTPVARVAFAAYAFARLREPVYVLFCCIVLVLILFGWFTGHTA